MRLNFPLLIYLYAINANWANVLIISSASSEVIFSNPVMDLSSFSESFHLDTSFSSSLRLNI